MSSEVQSIHNVMEELVKTEVERLFSEVEAQRPDWLSCTCPQCRADVICYVLNRVPAKYVRSGRGIAHYAESVRAEKSQSGADISAIALEGMKVVSQRKRPHFDSSPDEEVAPDAAMFNFPSITGRVLDGLSFEPLAGAKAELFLEGEPCAPLSASWENPCITNSHTPGNFAFAVKPIPASFEGERKVFEFEVRISAEGKDPVVHFVKIGVAGKKADKNAGKPGDAIVLPDLFVFPVRDKFDFMQ